MRCIIVLTIAILPGTLKTCWSLAKEHERRKMEVAKAVELFGKYNSRRKVVGYWKRAEGLILNTSAEYDSEGMLEPGQYIVYDSGKIVPTNPVRSDLNTNDYTEI
jgi:hypothetical protein